MSYSTATSQNFTMVDELPELDDIESQHRTSEQYSKFIRKPHVVPMGAGMMDMAQHQAQPQMSMPPQMPMAPPPMHEGFEHESNEDHEIAKKYGMASNSPSCLSVADHVDNCPICSKFYRNSDKTIYIIVIVVLIIICLLLFKRVLDK
jgi:hypothetical protein